MTHYLPRPNLYAQFNNLQLVTMLAAREKVDPTQIVSIEREQIIAMLETQPAKR